ncbi:hypothetical protein [Flocculibacter collagenilyticus]|uniref:hypothetical protein n=1 Tax=Flocculibacter collagenilyticus TaxID=2744479 RepID=UPI0018F4B334|nr:hypothetical protein [Flocculibacter collagenilyticus]
MSTETRQYNQPIPDASQVCVMELEVPSFKGQHAYIPFGLAATGTESEPVSDDEKPHSYSVVPQVFKDASLLRHKAGAPEFIPLNNEYVELQKGDALGYYYIFINGYLWREIAAGPNGELYEVDLKECHSSDIRPHLNLATNCIILPHRSKGLLTEEQCIAKPIVEMAFSRIQWSWEYITALGGMYEKDPRLSLLPLKGRCKDKCEADNHRTNRMQRIDYDEQTNMGITRDGSIAVYLHDIIGLAQEAAVESTVSLIRLQSLQASLTADPFYKSAVIAHCNYFNEELHEKISYYVPKAGLVTKYKNQGQQSNDARDVADCLSREELEKYLVGDPKTALQLIEKYTAARARLNDLLSLTCTPKNQTLAQICDKNDIQAPPQWEYIVKDFSTLSPINYAQAFELIDNMAISLAQSEKIIPIYLPAIINKNSVQEVQEELRTQVSKDADVLSSLIADDSWYVKQLFAPADLYGADLAREEYDESLLSTELGAFSPEKLKVETIKAQAEPFNVWPNFVFPYLNFADVKKRISGTRLTAVENFFQTGIVEHAKHKWLFSSVVHTLKAYHLPEMSKARLGAFKNIPDNHVIIKHNLKEVPILDKLKTKSAVAHFNACVEEFKTTGKLSKQNLKILAGHLNDAALPIGKGAKAIALEGGVTKVATTSRTQIIKIIKEAVDRGETVESLKLSKLEWLSVDMDNVPAELRSEISKNITQDTEYKALTKKSLKNATLKNSVITGIFASLATINAYMTYAEYEKSFKGKSGIYQAFKHIATIGAVMVAWGDVWQAIKRPPDTHWLTKSISSQYAPRMSFALLRSAGGIVGAVGGVVVVMDGLELLNKHDTDAAIAAITAGGMAIAGGILLTIGMGAPFILPLMLGAILFSLISHWLTDTRAEKWAKFGPFAKKKRGIFNGEKGEIFERFADAETYYQYIFSLLYSPKLEFSEPVPNYFIVEVQLAIFSPLESELVLKVPYQISDVYSRKGAKQVLIKGHHDFEPLYGDTTDSNNQPNDNKRLIGARYEFAIAVPSITQEQLKQFMYSRTDRIPATPKAHIAPEIELRYNNQITIPIDYDAIEAPITHTATDKG